MNLDKRCDGKIDCQDRSDEEECKVFISFKGYNKFLPPPPSGDEPKLSINYSINIDKIIEINEVDGYFKTKMTTVRKWLNSQLTYQNLKKDPTKNKISPDDMKKMWKPWFVVENIVETKDGIRPTDTPHIFMLYPNQEFNFQMDDKTNFRNTRLFKGDENVIHYQKQSTVQWVCDFDLRWYPFDIQKCTMEIYSPSSSITIIPSSVKYLGPKELTLHTVKNVTICSAVIRGNSGVIVEIVLGRPLFGTILTVFIPTCILLVLSQLVRVFCKDHLEMIIEVNLTLLLVLATL